jgi:hypothetical protein
VQTVTLAQRNHARLRRIKTFKPPPPSPYRERLRKPASQPPSDKHEDDEGGHLDLTRVGTACAKVKERRTSQSPAPAAHLDRDERAEEVQPHERSGRRTAVVVVLAHPANVQEARMLARRGKEVTEGSCTGCNERA